MQPQSDTTGPGSTREALQLVEEHRCVSLVAGNLEAVERLLDDELVYVHSTGRRDTKESLLRFLGKTTYLAIDHQFGSIREVGDLAVAQGVMSLRVLRDRAEREVASNTTSVWRHHDGAWLLRSFEGIAAQPITEQH